MVGEDTPIEDMQYVVILYDDHGISAAMTTEGKVFVIAIPFKKEIAAKDYIRTIGSLIKKKGMLFKRVG